MDDENRSFRKIRNDKKQQQTSQQRYNYTNTKKVNFESSTEGTNKRKFEKVNIPNVTFKFPKKNSILILAVSIFVIFYLYNTFNNKTQLSTNNISKTNSVEGISNEQVNERKKFIENYLANFKLVAQIERVEILMNSKWLQELDNPTGRMSVELGLNFDWIKISDISTSESKLSIDNLITETSDIKIDISKINNDKNWQSFIKSKNILETDTSTNDIYSSNNYYLKKINSINQRFIVSKDNEIIALALTKEITNNFSKFIGISNPNYIYTDNLLQNIVELHLDKSFILLKGSDKSIKYVYYFLDNEKLKKLSENDLQRIALNISRGDLEKIEGLYGYSRDYKTKKGNTVHIEVPNAIEYNKKVEEAEK